jgi:hypothetical protein
VVRTTVDLKKQVLARARAKAREAGRTLSELVNDAVAAYLAQMGTATKTKPFKLITSGDPKASAPGWEEIERILEREDLDALRRGR